MSFKIVLLPPFLDETLVDRVKETVPGVDVQSFGAPSDALEAIVDADAAYGRVPRELFLRARKLRWIAGSMAGLGRDVFYDELVKSPVVVTNMSGIYNDALLHHVLAFLLAFARRLDFYIPQQAQRVWKRGPALLNLPGSTVMVVGVGGSGVEVARLCSALGMRVLGVDPRTTRPPEGMEALVKPEAMDSMIGEAQFVVLTTPETPDTTGMFNSRRFALMQRGSYFINIGRGACVVTDDLVESLRSGHLAGAGLDVVMPEPLPSDHPLWTLPGVLLTPHVAIFGAHGPDERRVDIFLENCRRFARGEALLNVVDKEKWF